MLLIVLLRLGSCPLWFKVIVLSSQDASSSDKLPYYQMTPETLKNVTVVIGTPHNLPRCPDQVSTTPAKHKITDLGWEVQCSSRNTFSKYHTFQEFNDWKTFHTLTLQWHAIMPGLLRVGIILKFLLKWMQLSLFLNIPFL